MKHICRMVVFLLLSVALLAQQSESPVPTLPSDVPKDAVVRITMTDLKPSGQDAVWKTSDGVIHELFQFNDRGRGPKIYTTYRIDPKGIVVSEESSGVDYMKSAVQEKFSINSGNAVWKNQAENETQANAAGKFYIDLNGGPESGAILARALLKNDGQLPVLPGGTARIRKLTVVPVQARGKSLTATLYEISGLGFTPNYIWLDDKQQLLAVVAGWFSIAPQGYDSIISTLRDAQRKSENARASELAAKLTHKPSGDLVIRNVSVFDTNAKTLKPNQRVTVRSDRIATVDPETDQAPSGATVIDGKGKVLLPGLWDMHAHLDPDGAFLNIAAGVTSVRDLGNPIDDLTRLRHDIDSGAQIGPRVFPAGFIDGPGPFEGPIKVLAGTPEEATKLVDRYADLGYVQIKIYSSVKPELVPIIIEKAHKRGLRVSGHVPAGMIAEQFVRDGADEIQHMNFIFLNFMPDVKETRTPARFIEPGKRGAALDLNSQPVNDFIALLKEHHTVIDPTMATWENTYTDRPGKPSRIDQPMFERLPVQAQRGSKSGGGALGAADPQIDKLYRDSYANMVRMVKKLYDSGVQLVAGTDQGSGYALHRELEIYNEAGIPAPEVLRMATLEAATVLKQDKDFGSIEPGKFADMILVNGDPTKNISDIRHIDTVIKGGNIYKPSELYPAFGIRAE